MAIRKRFLPPGWYPAAADGVRSEVDRYLAAGTREQPVAAAGIAPHAGWAYSGAIAAAVVSALDASAQTVVVIGGHLGPRDPVLAAPEEAYETPLGPAVADLVLLEALRAAVKVEPDREPDNTVEVHLPLIRYLLPGSWVLGLRAPAHPSSFTLGEEIGRAAARLGRSVAVLGSTDLTHYGQTYGYAPHGGGPEAVRWVRDVNDARVVEAFLRLDPDEALRAARDDRSACSVGAALAAMGFARSQGATRGRLLRYATSLDVGGMPGEVAGPFVGYAGVAYAPRSARSTTDRASRAAASIKTGASG